MQQNNQKQTKIIPVSYKIRQTRQIKETSTTANFSLRFALKPQLWRACSVCVKAIHFLATLGNKDDLNYDWIDGMNKYRHGWRNNAPPDEIIRVTLVTPVCGDLSFQFVVAAPATAVFAAVSAADTATDPCVETVWAHPWVFGAKEI